MPIKALIRCTPPLVSSKLAPFIVNTPGGCTAIKVEKSHLMSVSWVAIFVAWHRDAYRLSNKIIVHSPGLFESITGAELKLSTKSTWNVKVFESGPRTLLDELSSVAVSTYV